MAPETLGERYGDKLRLNALAPGFFIGEQNRRLPLDADDQLTHAAKRLSTIRLRVVSANQTS